MGKIRIWALRIALILTLSVFLYSGYVLVNYWMDSRSQQQMHQELLEMTKLPEVVPQEVPGETAAEKQGEGESAPPEPLPTHLTVTDPNTGAERRILREYATLYQRNPELVGWIEIPGTNINYPVLQSKIKDRYLRRDFDRKWANHGSIYVWEQADVFAPSDNVTLFGHRMSDGSMFYDLLRYSKEKYLRSHPTFRFSTLEEHREYEIIAVFRTSGTGGEGMAYHTFINAVSQEAFDAFVTQCQELSLYDTGITAEYGDKLVTLSTCDYTFDNGRMVVVGRERKE